MASSSHRGRLRPSRYVRKRYDSDEEVVQIDWSKGVEDNLKDILWNIVRNDNNSTNNKIGHLNHFTKLCTRDGQFKSEYFSTLDILSCLRVALFHEKIEVKAAGIRAIRYFLNSQEACQVFCDARLDLLILRSIDVVLDNKLERVQCLRLIRKLIGLYPSGFTYALTRCLVSLARDGVIERDVLWRSCSAALAELTILNAYTSSHCGGISALLTCISQVDQSKNITEAMLGAIMYVLNDPKQRCLLKNDIHLQHFVSTFTDCYESQNSQAKPSDPVEWSERRENKFSTAQRVIEIILRSWIGLTYLNSVNTLKEEFSSGLKSLIESLHMPYTDTRLNILDLLFRILNLSVPPYVDDFQEALSSRLVITVQDSWQLYNGFVASEGADSLESMAKNRPNLCENYLAILVHSLVCGGLIDALVAVITKPKDMRNSVRATILLGEVLFLTSKYLPSDMVQQCHSLSGLFEAATSSENSGKIRDIACAAISCLNKIHTMKKFASPCHSVYLEQLIHFSTHLTKKKTFSETLSRTRLKNLLRKENDEETIASQINDSLVNTSEHNQWDWELISYVLNFPSEGMHKLDEIHHRNFIRRLVSFYKPSSKLFSQLENDNERHKPIARACCHLLDFLLEIDESKASVFLEDFIDDIVANLQQINSEKFVHNTIFGHTSLRSTLSHYYFLFVGRLSGSHKGKKLLEKSGVFQLLMETATLHDMYTKLICSSLDYTKEDSFARALLNKIISSDSESARLYATNFLRVLLRTNTTDFKIWGIQLLLQQLNDSNSTISKVAADILNEACDNQTYLEALIKLRPSFLHLGDTGILFMARFASCRIGFEYLKNSSIIDQQFELWSNTYVYKYVMIVEDLLNETLTNYRRTDSTYGRRSNQVLDIKKYSFLPVHLYGQLCQSDEGFTLLLERKTDFLSSSVVQLDTHTCLTARQCLELKAIMWIFGHIGSTRHGFPFLVSHRVVSKISEIAKSADVISLRGTAFYVLGLISQNPDAAQALHDAGWLPIQRKRNEKWPLVDQPFEVDYVLKTKEYSSSLSSCGTRLTELYDHLYGGKSSRHTSFHDDAEILDSSNCQSLSEEYSQLPKIDFRESSLNESLSKSITSRLLVSEERPRASSDICSPAKSPESFPDYLKSMTFIDAEETDKLTPVQRKISVPGNFKMRQEENSVDTLSSSFLSNNLMSKPNRLRSSVSLLSHSKSSPRESMYFLNASFDSRSDEHSAFHTLPRKSQSSPRNPHLPLSPSDNIPTTTDAVGYATLRAIQRTRVKSMGFYHPNIVDDDSNDSDNGSVTGEEHEHLSMSVSFNMSVSRTGFRKQRSESLEESETADNEDQCFVGICLPQCLTCIFDFPMLQCTINSNKNDSVDGGLKTHLHRLSDDDIVHNDGLDFHTTENCILCTANVSRDEGLGSNLLTVGSEGGTVSRKLSVSQRIKELEVPSSSATSASSLEAATVEASSQILVRREVLRFITNLSGSVAAKAAEQGLLNLKQRYPQAFQDICLYSEILLQMSHYNFRLSARRFIQELFLDLNFDKVNFCYLSDLNSQFLVLFS
ncbi:Rapamycin-insensitive companion of mTOR [Halotydeus destructor]|nr:Rapamycin-insensitive companion of mTOR [Halotydeus destructor]